MLTLLIQILRSPYTQLHGLLFFVQENHAHKSMAADQSDAGPRDAAVMEAILKEMGVQHYEPNVVHQMLEFSYSMFTTIKL